MALAGLVAAAMAAAFIVIQTDWFRELAIRKITDAVASATGGRVELAEFRLDPARRRATVRGFVLHGREPPGEEPLFRADRIAVQIKPLPALGRAFEISALEVNRPRANILVFPDGRTNIPKPNIPEDPDDKSPLETIVDLGVGRFLITEGHARFRERSVPFSARGENLHVRLLFDRASQRYRGQVDLKPLFVQSGSNPLLEVAVRLPVVIGRDKIELDGATLATAKSRLAIHASLEDLNSAKAEVRARGSIDLPEVAAALGRPLRFSDPQAARVAEMDIDAGLREERLRISKAKVVLGQSSVEVSGFRNTALEDGRLDIRASLVVGELARLLDTRVETSGRLDLAGQAQVRSTSDYSVNVRLTGQNLGYRKGNVRLADGRLSATITADPKLVRADTVRLEVAGGLITAQGRLENRNAYRVNGALAGFQVQRILAATLARESSVWGATVSGPVNAEGELKATALRIARTDLSIVPNGRGVPLGGRLMAAYDGVTESVNVGKSYLVFPSSRLEFSGSMNQRLDVRLVSRNLDDFRPALSLALSKPPAELPLRLEPAGSAALDATISGKTSSLVVAGQLQLTNFRAQERRFDRLAAGFRASGAGVTIADGILTRAPRRAAGSGAGDGARAPMEARLSISVGLRNWKVEPDQPVAGEVSIIQGDVRDILALAARPEIPIRGALAVKAHMSGTAGEPRGSAEIGVRDGEAYGEPLDAVDGRVSMEGQRIVLSSLKVQSNKASLDLNAVFEHPPKVYTSGALRGSVQANQVALARIAAVQKRRPELDGALQLSLTAKAILHPPETASRFELVAADGTLSLRNMRLQGDDLGDLSAKIETQGRELSFRLESDFAGSSIRADGRTTLAPDYPTAARLDIRDLPVEDVIKVSGKNGIDARGLLSARADVSGTWTNPEADLKIELRRAQYEKQPVDSVQAHVRYRETSVEVPDLEARAGQNRLSAEGSFTHAPRDFTRGDVKLAVKTNSVQLAQLAHLQRWRPGVAGSVRIDIEGAGRFDRAQTTMPVAISSFSAQVEARNLTSEEVDYGGLSISAEQKGPVVGIKLESDIAKSVIWGAGEVRMAAGYPISARIGLKEIRYSNWKGLISRGEVSNPSFDAVVEGKFDLSGPVLEPERMTGTAEFTKVEAYTTSRKRLGNPRQQIALRNNGPVTLALTPAGIEVRRALWEGPETKVSLAGKLALRPEPALNLSVDVGANLELLEDLDPAVTSSGTLAVKAAIKGTPPAPVVNGRIELSNAALQRAGMPLGISKASGVIELAGTTARIASLTAETGGGQLSITGSVTRAGGLYRFDVKGRARGVRVRTEAGASVGADASIHLSGTDRGSLVAGDVDIRTVSFNSRTDIGTMLSGAAEPPQTPGGEEGLLDAMRLDIDVRMGGDTTFRTTFSESLAATADLTVRGTARNPGVLGRINVTEGELVFFGTKYSVKEGTVSFYDPMRIEPVLNMSLETTARGINVTLVVSGPVHNLNLSYQSDPPLQFSEIVALLAVGKLPASDPVLLAKQPAAPQQSIPQMGASALVGAAVANPLASQLQRVFGVTQLKIDPTFTSGSELPQARLTLQQQISPELTFTYITNLTRSDPQIVRVEWAIDDDWSAIATRQENGMVGIDLFYKRRFH